MRPPQTAWIEITSKCPFDCVFCSRRNRRGAGIHMDIELVRRLCEELKGANLIRLNYSGESVNHPQFDEVLRLAKATGVKTELVSALARTGREEGLQRAPDQSIFRFATQEIGWGWLPRCCRYGGRVCYLFRSRKNSRRRFGNYRGWERK